MEIKIVGPGCASCKALHETVKQVVAELGIDATLLKEEDLVQILSYHVMSLPVLVVDGNVVGKGKMTRSQVKDLLRP